MLKIEIYKIYNSGTAKIQFILIFILLCFSPEHVFSQKLAPGKYWIQLTDKNNSKFSIHHPHEFLSIDAINRRIRHNISITEEDIPVVTKYTDILRNLGIGILGTSKWFNAVIVASDDSLLLKAIADLGFVKDFNPEKTFRVPYGGVSSFDNPFIPQIQQYPFHNGNTDYGAGRKQINMLNGIGLHDLGFRGYGKKIALLDAGFNNVNVHDAFKHLWDTNRITAVKDFVNSESDIYAESAHGMIALSTIAAHLPGMFIGTAPDADFLLLRTEDGSSEYKIEEANWIMAAEFADSAGVDIISTSLGYNVFDDSTMNYTYSELDGETALVTIAAEKAFSKGMIVVVSAGNEGNKLWNKITAPSDGENVIAVGSVDTFANLSAFSSRGPSYSGRIKPDVVAVGYETTVINSSGLVGRGYGTSFAAPQISGLTACLWQALPEKSNLELVQAIKKSSHLYSMPDNNMGFGIPNFMLAFHILSGFKDSEKRIWIFPNPFTNHFNLYFDISVEVIQIIDIFGKIVMSYEVNLEAFELKQIIPSELTPGVYLIVGRNKNEQRTGRLIKQ